jgi:TPR repeat protein
MIIKFRNLCTLCVLVICTLLPLHLQAQNEEISAQQMALDYYLPLAEQGEPYAQLAIGEIYFEGNGVSQDLVRAYAWLYVAVKQNVEEAKPLMDHIFKKLDQHQRLQAETLGKEFASNYSY